MRGCECSETGHFYETTLTLDSRSFANLENPTLSGAIQDQNGRKLVSFLIWKSLGSYCLGILREEGVYIRCQIDGPPERPFLRVVHTTGMRCVPPGRISAMFRTDVESSGIGDMTTGVYNNLRCAKNNTYYSLRDHSDLVRILGPHLAIVRVQAFRVPHPWRVTRGFDAWRGIFGSSGHAGGPSLPGSYGV